MRISDWSSDVCSSDLTAEAPVSLGEFEADIPAAQNDQMVGNPVKFERLDIGERSGRREAGNRGHVRMRAQVEKQFLSGQSSCPAVVQRHLDRFRLDDASGSHDEFRPAGRSEEHTSELQSLMRISYAVFCLQKKKK